MKVREIAEAVRRGEIGLEYAGHHVNATKERFLQRFDEAIANANGANDGQWNKSGESKVTDQDMREHFRVPLEREVEQEESFSLSFCADGESCFGCGVKVKWVLTGDKLQLREHFVCDPGDFRGEFENYPADYVCPFATPQPTKGEIRVASKLIFANFFRGYEDSPEDVKWSDEWSLCNMAGRKRITEFKVAQNIAYGQMGNMSIGIYVNKAKDSIIVGPCYHPAEMGEYESDAEFEEACKKEVFPGYKQMKKTISLAVWRWEATDFNTLGQEKYDALKNEEYMDMVELKVPHGIWSFEHYYDTRSHENEYLYALLQLKK